MASTLLSMSIEFTNGFQIISNKPFYSNFSSYIINGVRQASTYDLIRTNINSSRRFVVTETITFTRFRMVRIPPDNWTTLNYGVTGTLSIVAGSGGTIDGGSSNKSFDTKSVINRPSISSQRATQTWQYDILDVRPVNNSTTTLTPGEYNFNVFGTGANMSIATLTNTSFPIDTSRKIYPASNVSTHFPIEIF